MPYTHISLSQRNELSALLRAGTKQKDIARLLKKDRTSIWREQKRNSDGTYHAGIAKMRVATRKKLAQQRRKKISSSVLLQNYIQKKLKNDWSPEQIAGRLQRYYHLDKKKHTGKDSIYLTITFERKELVKHIRCQ